MRVLVTGGTGYLGQAVVRAFAAAGHAVRTYARTATQQNLPGERVDGDVRNAAALAAATAGCDVVCHTAALVALWRARPADFDDINVGGLHNVLRAAAQHEARVVYTSSFLALPPRGCRAPLEANHYQRSKVAAERVAAAAAERGADIVRLYPGVIYGPGVTSEGNLIGRMVRDHLAGRLPGIVGGGRLWSYAWIDDVAVAHVRAAERAVAGSAYVLGGVDAPQMRLFELARDLRGIKLPRRIPLGIAVVAGLVEEARAALLKRAPRITRGTVEIFRHDWPLDSGRAIGDLSYTITPLEQGVERLLADLLSSTEAA